MVEYHKIKTIFERDIDGTKKLIEGEYRDKAVEYLKDCEWIFTEKVDGTNIRVMWDGHKVAFAGRTDRAEIPTRMWDVLNNYFRTDEAEQIFEQIFGEQEAILYGEGYGGKIQKGANYKETEDFILFDIEVNGCFYSLEACQSIAKALDIEYVPVIHKGKLSDGVEIVKNKQNLK